MQHYYIFFQKIEKKNFNIYKLKNNFANEIFKNENN